VSTFLDSSIPKGQPVLQRVENASLLHDAHALTGKGWLVFVLSGRALFVGSKKVHKSDFGEMQRRQAGTPVYVVSVNGWHLWMFGDRFYSSLEWMEPNQVFTALVSGDFAEHRASA
jgi:hypothetical protein